jgi:protoporphyrinogen oxidase
LLVDKERLSDSHWFYFADRDFIINRVAEFKNFANGNAPRGKTVVCCEVTEVDHWSLDRVIEELSLGGLLRKEEVLDHKIIDIKHAYPVYDRQYEEEIARVDDFFADHPAIFHVGRHAQFAHKDIDEIFDEAKRVAGRVMRRHSETRSQGERAPVRSAESLQTEVVSAEPEVPLA